MKKIFRLSCIALMAMAAMTFVACDDDDDKYVPAEWDANANYADVYFPKSSMNQELEPTAACEVQIPIKRRNTSGAVTVPIKILVNDGNVFSVAPAVFESGSEDAVVKVSFPSAETGIPYSLEMTIEGADYVSSYSTNTLFSYTVQRVKWNDVGFYYTSNGGKVEGMCLYTDDFVTTFYGVDNVTYPVRVQERDDMPGYFRVYNVLGEAYPYNDPGDYDDSQDYYLFIDATNPNKVFIPLCVQGTDWGYGNFMCYSIAGLRLAQNNPSAAEGYYGTYANGVITFPQDALLFGMQDYNSGGLYGSNSNGAFSLVIDPDKVLPDEPEAYVADIESDFEWEEVFTGAFNSAITGNTSSVTLMKGTCVNTTDDCDKVFEETYGTAYALLDPYGADAPIFFGVKDGAITLPYAGLQATGMKALNENVYATINAKKSSFTEKVITLNMTFQNKSGSLVYGTTDEVLANIKWNLVGTGTFTYAQFFEGDDEGLELYQREDMPNIFKIEHWGYDVDFMFTWDQETNEIVVSDQFMGYEDPDYGEVWVDELSDYAGQEMDPSYFDPETNTFYFGVVYYVAAGNFGYGYETFTLDASEPASFAAKALSRAKFNWQSAPANAVKRANKLVGKQVNLKSFITSDKELIF